jgi:hypothetical protein
MHAAYDDDGTEQRHEQRDADLHETMPRPAGLWCSPGHVFPQRPRCRRRPSVGGIDANIVSCWLR